MNRHETATVDGIIAATNLRRSVIDVQRELAAKREEYKVRMSRVRDAEEQLARDRVALQETLVQYYKFIQENEIKRARATKKAQTEEAQRKEREEQLRQLNAQMATLELKRDEIHDQLEKLSKYQCFLEEMLSRNVGDEYQEPKDIVKRWMTLRDNTAVLQKRKTQLEEELLRNKNALNLARQRRSNHSIALQNQLNELQLTFEGLQKSIKLKQDELDRKTKLKSSTTRTVSHISMATRNLYDRCILWTSKYSGRRRASVNDSSSVLTELHIIGDCLEDFQSIIVSHLEISRP